MPPITIYTKATCPYCIAAKDLLNQKKLAYNEISVDGKRDLQAAMAVKAHGRSTVPQIFIGEKHIGGCDDLYDLDAMGKLDAMLTA